MTSLSTRRASPLAVIPLLIPLLIGCTDEPPPQGEVVRPVKAMQVADFAGFVDRSFPGKAKATQEVNLSLADLRYPAHHLPDTDVLRHLVSHTLTAARAGDRIGFVMRIGDARKVPGK
jgi:hypothetical protein